MNKAELLYLIFRSWQAASSPLRAQECVVDGWGKYRFLFLERSSQGRMGCLSTAWQAGENLVSELVFTGQKTDFSWVPGTLC